VRVLVTGASGFVGGVTARELLARGHEVHALVRRPGSEPPGTTAVVADLADSGALRDAVAAVAPEAVVHLAAEIASQRDAKRIHEVNVEGTRRLLDACRAASGCRRRDVAPEAGPAPVLPRFVFVSTVVTGDAGGHLLTEERPLPVQTAYGRSKQEGERLVAESGLASVVIRPGHVYGPGGWYAEEILPLLRRPGRFAVIGRGDNWWDVVHVDDVADAIVSALERAPDGALYHVADDEPIRLYDFLALTAQQLGRRRARARGGGTRRGARRHPQRAHLERAHPPRARLASPLPQRARGRARGAARAARRGAGHGARVSAGRR
jgi:nucleoside-diphosphate-sugar epimerase